MIIPARNRVLNSALLLLLACLVISLPIGANDKLTLASSFDSHESSSEGGGSSRSGTTAVPTAGQTYLVQRQDTLWSIATRAAPDEVSSQQTMLSIVELNPEAFDSANVNGLRAGYVLTIPNQNQISTDPRLALTEVSRQNRIWGSRSQSGTKTHKIVFDADLVLEEIRPAATIRKWVEEPDVEPDLVAPEGQFIDAQEATQDSGSVLFELEFAVRNLEKNIMELQTQLAEKDREISGLKTELSQSTSKLLHTINAIKVFGEKNNPLDTLGIQAQILGGLLLASLAVMSIWLMRRRRVTGDEFVSGQEPSENFDERGDELGNSEKLQNDVVSASVLKEADNYVAYGRLGQAVEVLKEAISEGVKTPAIKLKLLSLYIETERSSDAEALYSEIKESNDENLIASALEMIKGAGAIVDSNEVDDYFDGLEDVSEVETSAADHTDQQKQKVTLSDETPIDLELKESEQVKDIADHSNTVEDPEILNESNSDSQSILSSDSAELDYTEKEILPEESVQDPALGEPTELTPDDGDSVMDDPIYGAETDPIDSNLDLARAYIDMGDNEGALAILQEVIKTGDVVQQAQARELLARLEAS